MRTWRWAGTARWPPSWTGLAAEQFPLRERLARPADAGAVAVLISRQHAGRLPARSATCSPSRFGIDAGAAAAAARRPVLRPGPALDWHHDRPPRSKLAADADIVDTFQRLDRVGWPGRAVAGRGRDGAAAACWSSARRWRSPRPRASSPWPGRGRASRPAYPANSVGLIGPSGDRVGRPGERGQPGRPGLRRRLALGRGQRRRHAGPDRPGHPRRGAADPGRVRTSAVAITGPDAWVTNSGDGTVPRVSTVTGRAVDTIPVGNLPVAIAAGSGGVWVANRGRRHRRPDRSRDRRP